MRNYMAENPAIVVPIYKLELSDSEIFSLKLLEKYLKDFKIFTIGPNNTEQDFPQFSFINFNPSFFEDTNTYSKLLLSKNFYNSFTDYSHILIYQMDCLVFSSSILKWCSLDYDYIGAPLFKDNDNPEKGFSFVGNGGFSLRRISGFLNVLNSKNIPNWVDVFYSNFPDRYEVSYKKKIKIIKEARKGINWYSNNYSLNEDLFWSQRAKLFSSDFKIAPVELAVDFAFEANPRHCYDINNKKLPFGVHAWEKWDKEFWLDLIDQKIKV